MRKIVQIAIAGYVSTADEQGNPSLVVLCDDGTVWIKRAWSGTIWYREPDIPPEEAPHEH